MRVGINAHLLSFEGNYRQAGLSRYIDELLFRIPRLAPDLDFTGYTGPATLPAEVQARKPANLALSRSRLPTQRPQARILWEQTALPLAAARDRLDLLHCPVNVRPFALTTPAVVTIHDLIFLKVPASHRPLKRLYLSAMTGWSARHSAHVITVSEATRRDVIKLLKVPPRRVTTVHNGVGEEFRPCSPAEKEAFRREKGIEGRAVLTVGTLEPRKNLPVLLKAFAALVGQPGFEDVTLYVGGSKGWYYDEIFATAEQLGLTANGRVRFLGRVPDEELPLWYNIAAVVAYPSIYEGFGLPALEAMACGTPVLASNASALPEVVGDAGVLLSPGDTEAWTAALARLLGDDALRAQLGSKALRQASKFSWERSARETLEVYRRHLGKQAKGERRRG